MTLRETVDSIPEGARKSMVKFTKVFVVAAIIFYAAFRLSGIDSEVGTLYFRYAEAMASGKMPYSGFDAEYPPFAMLIIFLPRLISFSSFTYQIAFGIEAYLFLLAGVYWTYRIAERYTDKPGRIADLYIVFTVILLDFVLDRYDVFPMVMLLGSIYFFTRERYTASWIMLALGTVTKLYPALAAPVFLIYLLRRRRYDLAAKGVGICLVIGIACMVPFFIADPDTALMFLTYHMDRGLQTEAPVSSVFMLLGNLGLMDVSYVFNYGSDNIYGPVPDAVAKLMMPLMVILVLALYVYYAFLGKKEGAIEDCMPRLILVVFGAVMVFMLVNKVLSSQYLVWMVPFVALLILLSEKDDRKRAMYVFAASVVLTQLNLIVNYAFRDAGEEFSLLGIIILLSRNVLLFVLVYYLAKSKHLKPSAC